MIYRFVEYGIRCDNDDCPDGNTHVWGADKRDECAKGAAERGWIRCTRNRWLCPRCKHLAETQVFVGNGELVQMKPV